MWIRFVIAGLVAAICVLPPGSNAQTTAQPPAPVSDAAQALAGSWEISSADREQVCTVILKAEGPAAALKLDIDKACGVPPIKDVTGWTLMPNDAVRLLDGRGRVVFEFSEVESGMYEGNRPEGLFFMQNSAGAAQNAERKPEQMFGDWAITRNDTLLCTLTLSNQAAGPNAYAVAVKPGCGQPVSSFGPFTWELNHGELTLKSARGQAWRFEEFEESMWRRVSDDDNPLILARP